MSALQAQRNVQEVVFGPYTSRRFGRSLGVNPLPRGARFCNFDCIYCECATGAWPLQWDLRPQFPTAGEIRRELAAQAEKCEADELDAITIAGNGEPTLSDQLNDIVDAVTEIRDRDWPQARTVILTNGTMCHKSNVRSALAKLDERVVKLDAGSNWLLEQINRPAGKLTMAELVRRISMTADIIVQSMFVHGPADNTGAKEIAAWTDWLLQLAPHAVQIYSLDRAPAKSWVRQVPRPELESIARVVESTTGIPARVY
jgi:wyosine [tRNA(Phe)-imidazoG37] synthetase (radical SAM superfamily)